jgi:hypothetical protein
VQTYLAARGSTPLQSSRGGRDVCLQAMAHCSLPPIMVRGMPGDSYEASKTAATLLG